MRKVGVKKKNYFWISGLMLVTLLFFIIFKVINNPPKSTPLSPEINAASTFYIGWGGGAIARKCPNFSCEVSYSFKEQEALELPYSDMESMPEWVDVSEFCKKDCFANKSVFSTDPDTAIITPDWDNKVVKIVCSDNTAGSGLLTLSIGKPAVVTARHVIAGKEQCAVYPPKQQYKLAGKNSFEIHNDLDLGIILLGEFNESVDALAKEFVNVCKDGTKTEDILVFGYPDTISSNTASVVKGIISNFDQYSYAIDANIGPGYSGGVAVKKNDGCYLGIPSFVTRSSSQGAEGIGNLGVILKATNLKYD